MLQNRDVDDVKRRRSALFTREYYVRIHGEPLPPILKVLRSTGVVVKLRILDDFELLSLLGPPRQALV